MGVSHRYYIFPADGEPLRMSQRLANGLVHGEDFIPQFANSRQKVLLVLYEEGENGSGQIIHVEGSIWHFDDEGSIQEGFKEALSLAMNAVGAPESNEKVVHLRPLAGRGKLQKDHRWEPESVHLERVIADIWPKRKSDRLKRAEGVAKRRHNLTWDARVAIDEIASGFWKIEQAIETLKEPSLKSFTFEAHRRSAKDPDYSHLYGALAEMADWHLVVQQRKRTGKGNWYGVVEVTLWRDNVGKSLERHHEKCGSRAEAAEAVRRLLVEHAGKFGEHVTVEGELLTDLEWERRALD